MFLSISVEGEGAESLSFVVQKHPARVFERSNSKLFFPHYGKDKSSMVLMTEFPEYKLWNSDTLHADAYVTSREYALSSLFCREIKDCLNTAISGKYRDEKDQALADRPMRLIVDALPLATSLTDDQIRGLFAPLGYLGFSTDPENRPGAEGFFPTIKPTFFAVDHTYQHSWMPKRHRVLELTLRANKTVREVLRHLLVLIPVIDNYTHYTELDTLVAELKAHGDGWLDSHPMKGFIIQRFLRHSKRLMKEFDSTEEKKDGEAELEKHILLQDLRTAWFVSKAKESGARSVVDAGCGAGRLAEAVNAAGVLEVSAFDCHGKAVQAAGYRLKNKANVFFSSLMYRDDRLLGKDMFMLQEVVEHMPAFQLGRAVDLLFGHYRPKTVLMSTPNRSYNKIFGMADGQFRHRDHKFEWDEKEAAAFVADIEVRFPYKGRVEPIGQDYVPPSAKECAEMDERFGRVRQRVKDGTISDQSAAVATMEPAEVPKSVHTDVAPTFGIVFERIDK